MLLDPGLELVPFLDPSSSAMPGQNAEAILQNLVAVKMSKITVASFKIDV